MKPFETFTSIAAPLMRINIDTDAIIPSREMKKVSKVGLSEGLFAGWRYANAESRKPNPDFILNRSPFQQAKILIAGRNFGCGSSREHAVWALREWGIRTIIAPSFGAIFRLNCIRNGVLPIILDATIVENIAGAVQSDPLHNQVTVDLHHRLIQMPILEQPFEIADSERQMLLEGLDMIAQTLKSEAAIERFEQADQATRAWAR